MIRKEEKINIKILLLGEGDDCPSNILTNFLEIGNNSKTKKDFAIKKDIIDNKKVRIILTDMSGKANVSKIKLKNTINTDCVMIIYNVSSRESFENVDTWINAIKDKCDKNIHKYLVACNNVTNIKFVENDEGSKLAELRGMNFYEINTKDKAKVDSLISNVSLEILNDNSLEKSCSFHIKAIKPDKKKKSKCC